MKKRNKHVAGLLALFFGWFGAHRFYLGQNERGGWFAFLTGMALWGARIPVIGRLLSVAWIPIAFLIGMIDAIVFFSMDKRRFDEKYNGIPFDRRDRSTDFERTVPETEARRQTTPPRRTTRPHRRPRPAKRTTARQNNHNKIGKEKFADYDYEGAIVEFEKSVQINPADVAAHFNLACAYSLTENVEKAFYHLELAVAQGFNNFKKIQEHHALAYLRIQPRFVPFVQNGYRMPRENTPNTPKEEDDLLATKPDLLDQLKKLAELREQGFLTTKEFEIKKEALMQNAQ